MFGKKSSLKDVLSEHVEPDGQMNSVELDIDKKVLVLENSLNKLRDDVGAVSEVKNLKESLVMLADIRAKMREMEDLELITKLETIQTQDEIGVLTDDMGVLESKMELLSNAMKVIATKVAERPGASGHGSKVYDQKIVELERKYDSIDYEFKKFVSDDVQAAENKFSAKLGSSGSDADYLKYVPVLKENVSKLYKVFNRTEKRIADVEAAVLDVKDGAVHDVDGRVEGTVDAELSDVVGNINALSADIKSQVRGEALKQGVLMDALRKDFDDKLLSMKPDVDDALEKKGKGKSYNYEEFAEFRAKVSSEIDELKKGVKKAHEKVSSSDVESILDDKLMPHVSNQDKIAKSVAVLNRKIEQRHLEVSKTAHEKIGKSVKPVVDRLAQIEGDVAGLQDMREDIVGDVKALLDGVEAKYDKMFRELLAQSDGVEPLALDGKIRAVQTESDVLRQELEKMKMLYFEMIERQKDAPVIIE